MSRELQATDQMGPRVVPRSLGPTVVGGGAMMGRRVGRLQAPLLDLFYMVEEVPEVEFGKNNCC